MSGSRERAQYYNVGASPTFGEVGISLIWAHVFGGRAWRRRAGRFRPQARELIAGLSVAVAPGLQIGGSSPIKQCR